MLLFHHIPDGKSDTKLDTPHPKRQTSHGGRIELFVGKVVEQLSQEVVVVGVLGVGVRYGGGDTERQVRLGQQELVVLLVPQSHQGAVQEHHGVTFLLQFIMRQFSFLFTLIEENDHYSISMKSYISSNCAAIEGYFFC